VLYDARSHDDPVGRLIQAGHILAGFDAEPDADGLVREGFYLPDPGFHALRNAEGKARDSQLGYVIEESRCGGGYSERICMSFYCFSSRSNAPDELPRRIH